MRAAGLPALSVAALWLLAPTADAQPQTNWNAPFPPHRVIDNVYYVGTEALGSFLITTPAGHILVNSDFESTVPSLQRNIETLGFKFADIKILLGSHAHGDHMEGDALVKQPTGAQVMAMAEDVPTLRNVRPGGKEHPIDRILHDGDEVKLGGTTLVAHLTPGHTKGCTSWGLTVAENGRRYDALIVCSFGVNDNYVLVGNADYPSIATDYVATFAKARALPVDVFLGAHGSFYGLAAKYAALEKRGPGDANPFIDHAGYIAHIAAQEQRFQKMLAAQQAAAR
ncbi:MAG TPA: subclass B3 metallo-beta-lactamase [Gammaproteobacteria bacterium]|nr:subclass B3 metallo-beta-lactamase [Gammaproteobacteria bacterium]